MQAQISSSEQGVLVGVLMTVTSSELGDAFVSFVSVV